MGARWRPQAVVLPPLFTILTIVDIYVAESHTDVADPNLVGRISVFDKTGKFLRVIGKAGTGPGEFRTPHDGKVTIFIPPHTVPNSADGAMGEGIAIDAAGNIYTAEAQLRGVTKYVRE